tara:strand:+ start:23839 stop:24558 length:720 start_codon:yes stop_codon:yes gene_type:complete
MEYTNDEREVGFETYRHIWHVQRMLAVCIEGLFTDLGTGEQVDLVDLLSSVCTITRPGHLERLWPTQDPQLLKVITNTYNLFGDTPQHLQKERENFVVNTLVRRMITHDQSKLGEVEVKLFTEYTPRLGKVKFGSDEYKVFLKGLKPALENHYAKNRHHPEFYKDGIFGMTLIDVIEMVCDWTASSLRTADGSFENSLQICKHRFELSSSMAKLMQATYDNYLAPIYNLQPADYEQQTI